MSVAAASICGALSSHAAGAPPQGRAYEMVSPVDKSGGDVMAYSARTHTAGDGDAIAFGALLAFGDAQGTGTGVEYMAQRSPQGWMTHAITPRVTNNTLKGALATTDVYYDGDFSPDFEQAVLFSGRPITDDPSVAHVANLYLRDDLRSAGAGSYRLVTACPLCDATGTPLAPLPATPGTAAAFLPAIAATSPDMGHVTFESIENLTPDAPAQPAECGSVGFPGPAPIYCRPRLYEWDHGTLRLAGILPNGTPADASVAGTSALHVEVTPHVVSDGSDGHSRVFFVQPTDGSGRTMSQLGPSGSLNVHAFVEADQGNLFMRVDDAQTIQLNASERRPADAFSPAQYLDASDNGERIFFMTEQALTADAPTGTDEKIYMYDASKADSAPDNLTLVSRDEEPADDAAARGLAGISRDGHYAYLIVTGQLVRGDPLDQTRIFLWHDGAIADVAPVSAGTSLREQLEGGPSSYRQVLRQARVTPDGRHVEFTTLNSFGGYDQGSCFTGVGVGCREVYVWGVGMSQPVCISCNPSGAPATVMASVPANELHGATADSGHENRGLSDDGRYAFFSTAEALVPEDVNGKSDAYVYDTQTRTVSLLSTGTSTADSWYLDSGADGRDVFVVTRQQLSGWDRDSSYDIYDARIGGGLPEPPPSPVQCAAGTCQGALALPPAAGSVASESYSGPGNARGHLKARRRAVRCKRGFVRKRVRGKTRCVKRRARRARTTRRTS